MNAAPERDVARTCIRWLRLVLPAGSIVATISTERRGGGATEQERARFGAALKKSGVVTGFLDAVAVIPGGRSIWLEWKRPDGGVVSDRQAGMHERMRSLGHAVIVANSIETCRGGLQALGVPLREAPGQLAATARVRVAKRRDDGLRMAVELP